MPVRKIASTVLVMLGLLCAGIPGASAASCDALRSTLRGARNELVHARSESNLVRARRYARQANQSLDRAAKQALECACHAAHREFRSAASFARRAKSARDPQQFSEMLKRSLRKFDSASLAVRRCGRKS